MVKIGKLDFYFKGSVVTSRALIFGLLSRARDPYTLDRLLAEADDMQLWMLVRIFRGDKKYWRNFLIALLKIPATDWHDRQLMPENARESFTPEEKKEIRVLHTQMITEGKHSPILQLM